MTDAASLRPSLGLKQRLTSPGLQSWAARFPLTRPFVRKEGERLFDLVAGFCHSQILMAVIRLDLIGALGKGASAERLSAQIDVPVDRLIVLLNASKALGLVKKRHDIWRPTVRGATLIGVPGLAQMIDHHEVLYRDLQDPAAFFRGDVETELAQFWPYVFGAGMAEDPARAARYSRLMSDSQRMVAEDTLATAEMNGVDKLVDIGGGTGAFLRKVRQSFPSIDSVLFDLPAVVAEVNDLTVHPGSFRDDPLPIGADAFSLIRVLYDHDDTTVAALLAKVHDALPANGKIIISEPMGGSRAGDAYFALYCLAMQTGRVRSSSEIGTMLRQAGFEGITFHKPRRDYITSVITAVRPS